MGSKVYKYFVEGDCEEKLINSYKIPPYYYFQAGKVEVFNFIKREISNQRLIVLNPKTIVFLVYDIDVEETKILEINIKKLKENGNKIYHIQSIRNFEDELAYSTNRNIKELEKSFNSIGINDLKTNFLHQTNLDNKLKMMNFDIDKMWSRVNNVPPFNIYSNEEALKRLKNR